MPRVAPMSAREVACAPGAHWFERFLRAPPLARARWVLWDWPWLRWGLRVQVAQAGSPQGRATPACAW
eukprot:11501318-Alexandrium_andersonii.AAC.1